MVGRETPAAVSTSIKLKIEVVDAWRVPCFCAYCSDCFEMSSNYALEGWLVCLSIHVDLRPVPVSSGYGWQWLIVEVVIVRTGHDLDVTDCVVVEQISVHVAIVSYVTGKQLAYSSDMHWLGQEILLRLISLLVPERISRLLGNARDWKGTKTLVQLHEAPETFPKNAGCMKVDIGCYKLARCPLDCVYCLCA